MAAARAFREREGHLDVPQRHVEEFEGERVRLGQWLTNLRRRHSSLSQQRRAALAELCLQPPAAGDEESRAKSSVQNKRVRPSP
ncbi:helicase associated domain-containing protein [Streptomyces sp. NPDC057889]|uniref:helicase associated domain-containing protein n=1 Tax=unclassified Streptomyces TaxID=2593676 RepID=UPI0036B75D67